MEIWNGIKLKLCWLLLDAMLLSSGSSVSFEKDGIKEFFHRPHPAKETLRYRVKIVRSFLIKLGITQKDLL